MFTEITFFDAKKYNSYKNKKKQAMSFVQEIAHDTYACGTIHGYHVPLTPWK